MALFLWLMPRIYWPLLYTMMILHELIHLICMLIFMLPIQSISIGTMKDTNRFNFGLEIEGYISFHLIQYDRLLEIPKIQLYFLAITVAMPALILVPLWIYAMYSFPLLTLLTGIPFIYFCVGHIGDLIWVDQILTALAAKRRIEKNRSRLGIDK